MKPPPPRVWYVTEFVIISHLTQVRWWAQSWILNLKSFAISSSVRHESSRGNARFVGCSPQLIVSLFAYLINVYTNLPHPHIVLRSLHGSDNFSVSQGCHDWCLLRITISDLKVVTWPFINIEHQICQVDMDTLRLWYCVDTVRIVRIFFRERWWGDESIWSCEISTACATIIAP